LGDAAPATRWIERVLALPDLRCCRCLDTGLRWRWPESDLSLGPGYPSLGGENDGCSDWNTACDDCYAIVGSSWQPPNNFTGGSRDVPTGEDGECRMIRQPPRQIGKKQRGTVSRWNAGFGVDYSVLRSGRPCGLPSFGKQIAGILLKQEAHWLIGEEWIKHA